MVVRIPESALVNFDLIFGNKAVIAFETQTSPPEVVACIFAFNEEHPIKLTLHDELPNALYVVQFDIHVNQQAREDLIALSPIKH